MAGTPQGERDTYPTRLSMPGGAERTYGYDSLGRLASATDLSGAAWSYSVQADGLKETVTTPDGDLLREDILNADLDVTSRRFGDGGITSFTYALSTDPIRITKPSGETIDLTYGAAGRITSRETSGGDNDTFTWNAIGDPLSFTDVTGTSTWSYDAAGRPSQLSHSDGSSLAWTWDVLGRLASVTVTSPGGVTSSTTSYRYNAVGDLVEVETPALGISSFEYDEVRRLRRRTLPNGVVSEWTYDPRDRVSSVQHIDPSGTILASYVYSRGPGRSNDSNEKMAAPSNGPTMMPFESPPNATTTLREPSRARPPGRGTQTAIGPAKPDPGWWPPLRSCRANAWRKSP